jgi:hypothetical protein
VASCPAPVRVLTKAPVLPLHPQTSRAQLPGSGATLNYTTYSCTQGIPQPVAGLFGLAEAGHGLSLMGEAAPWVAVRENGSPDHETEYLGSQRVE